MPTSFNVLQPEVFKTVVTAVAYRKVAFGYPHFLALGFSGIDTFVQRVLAIAAAMSIM
jgi:hypothetical protein